MPEQPSGHPDVSKRRAGAAIVIAGIFAAAVLLTVAGPGAGEGEADVTYLGEEGVVRQIGPSDCGVAAMEMVYRALGAPPELLEPVRREVLDRDLGLTFLEMRDLAAEHGLEARGWRSDDRDLPALVAVGLPAIAHYRNHYVVVDSVGDGWVEIRDPSAGRLRLSGERFRERWTGNVLSLQSS